MLFEKGLGQIKQEAREAMEQLDESDPEDFAKMTFFQASLLTLEGMSAYMKRLGDLASELAVSADGERKKELVEIADNCYALMEKKPENFWQGLQFIYFILVGCLMEGNLSLIHI